MSARIEQILEVLNEVRNNFKSKKGNHFDNQWRINATHLVAKRWDNIDYQTVKDKYARNLEPDIKGVDRFDRYLEKWLIDDSYALRSILLKHVSDTQDSTRINTFFKATEKDE